MEALTASSVCIGRSPSCGRRTASASRATAKKIAQRILGGGFAKHFDLDVVVQFVGRVTVAIKADVATFDAFRGNQLALIGFDVGPVFADAEAEFVGGVIVVNRRHA